MAGLSWRSSTRRRPSGPARKARRRTRWAYAASCSLSTTSTMSLPACATMVASSSTRSRSTRTSTGCASCVALKASSSAWPSSSDETSMGAAGGGADGTGHRPLAGCEASEIGDRIYGDADPTKLMYSGQTYRVAQEGKAYVLEPRLPIAHEGEVKRAPAGDERVIGLANPAAEYRCPNSLRKIHLVTPRSVTAGSA